MRYGDLTYEERRARAGRDWPALVESVTRSQLPNEGMQGTL